jgi:hypothetical protein
MSQARSGGFDGLALAASPTFAIMALLTLGVLAVARRTSTRSARRLV